jgi:SpoVK/Ycf46/Vps4 family AAA+-type ATPase
MSMNLSGIAAMVAAFPARLWQASAGFVSSGTVLYVLPVPIIAGALYLNSRGHLAKRAEKGSLPALGRLTKRLLPRGKGAATLRDEGERLLHSARIGSAWAMHEIGKKLLSGEAGAFQPDAQLGKLWIRQAANYGHPEAVKQLKKGAPGAAGGVPPLPGAAPLTPPPAADPFRELYGLIGLEGIKKTVADIADRARLFQMRRAKGLTQTQPALHLVFMGNPGTGKTVVARIIGGILKQTGYLPSGHLVEVSVPEMISQYVGDTPQKVRDNVIKAMGGVLFIDEAYALLGHQTSGGSNYGAEAVATLLKLMEDNKERLVVIAAGYPGEMHAFLDANPGFRSRFTDIVQFEDYGPEELVTIFHKLARESQFKIDALAERALIETMREARTVFAHNFSNGRFVRNLFEQSVKGLASRVSKQASPSRQDIELLTAEDVRGAFAYIAKSSAGATTMPATGAGAAKPPPRIDPKTPPAPPKGSSGAKAGPKSTPKPDAGQAAEPSIVLQGSSLSAAKLSGAVEGDKAGGPELPTPGRIHPLLGELENAVDPIAELAALVGLAEIKKAVSDIGDRARHFEQRRKQGLPAARPAVHMALQGPPGTGKTTVARLMGRILKQTGYLARGQVFEIQLPDLLGADAGSTAARVRDAVAEAQDGVLLVDGAYALSGDDGQRAREAVALLFKLMEDNQERLAAIFTGYETEMRALFEADPGFRARITDLISFPDYGPEDLERIYLKFAKDQHYAPDAAAAKRLTALMKKAVAEIQPLSNGRFVRNLFEDSVKNLAARTDRQGKTTREDMQTIRSEDIELAYEEALRQEKSE